MAKDIPGVSSARLPHAPSQVPQKGSFGRAPGGDQIRDLRGHFSGGFAINWVGLGDLQKELTAIPGEVERGMVDGAESLARDIEAYAKENAPWTDHTGDARRELHSFVVRNRKDEVSVVLAHGVDY